VARGAKRLTCREALARLKKYGVVEARQSGSHIILLKPEAPGSTKGRTAPLPCHDQGSEVNPHILRAVLRRLGIGEEDFWKE